MKIALSITLSCVLSAFGIAQQKAYVSPSGTQFLLYTPPSYSTSSEEYPLLVSLHGKGEWGTDLTKLTSGNPTGMPSCLIYQGRWPANYKFIVVTPQYNPPDPDEPNPVWPSSHIDEVVDYVLANWRVNKSQVYVTGLSFGANATWNYSAAYPQKVAAIVPVSGRADFTKACLLKDIPAWVFHGDGDATATSAYSRDMVQAIKNCRPEGKFNQHLNILFTKYHEGWDEIYDGSGGYNIYDWMLGFARNSSVSPPPCVNAGPDLHIMSDAGQVTLAGEVFTSSGEISTIDWRQISGAALKLKNTDSASLSVNELMPGIFEFEITAIDDQGQRASDKILLEVHAASSLPAITGMVLINGASDKDLFRLSTGVVIDKEHLGTNQFNVRATATSDTRSVRFSVNSFRSARTVNAPGPFLIKPTQSLRPEWEIAPGVYTICATPFTESNAKGTQGISYCADVRVIEGVPREGCDGAGVIYREVWTGVPGNLISDIPLSIDPTVVSPLYSFEAPTGETGAGDNYASRIRGYLCPPATGEYTFWIASDEQSELWLSTDQSPANKVRIAFVSGLTASRDWAKYESQKSVEITLNSDMRYYIEALHKEANLGDHLAVGWQLPDGTFQRPIPGIRLIPFIQNDDPTELPEEDPSGDVEVYPNPVSSIENIIKLRGFARQNAKPVRTIVIAPTGQIINSKAISCGSFCDDIEIQLDNGLPPGIYSIQILTPERRIPKRFIVR